MIFMSITIVSAAICVLVYFIGHQFLKPRRDGYEEPLLEGTEDLDAQLA